jgi:hypothetical protein
MASGTSNGSEPAPLVAEWERTQQELKGSVVLFDDHPEV